jgi:hypothetical protein
MTDKTNWERQKVKQILAGVVGGKNLEDEIAQAIAFARKEGYEEGLKVGATTYFEKAKREAVEEFAEKLKDKLSAYHNEKVTEENYWMIIEDIDSLTQEQGKGE